MAVHGSRITARIRRTEAGELHHEYVAGGKAYESLEALVTGRTVARNGAVVNGD